MTYAEQHTPAAWIEAFTIFGKYTPTHLSISVTHDQMYAGPPVQDVSEDDCKRLEELGWFVDEGFECFSRFV